MGSVVELLLVVVPVALVVALAVAVRRTWPRGQVAAAPTTTPGHASSVVLASCNVTLAHLAAAAVPRYEQLLEASVSASLSELEAHVGPDDQPGMAFAVDVEGTGEKEASGVLLVLRGKSVLAWASGASRQRVSFSSVVLPIARPGQIVQAGRLPRNGMFEPGRILLQLDGPPRRDVTVFDVDGMDAALSLASGIPNGSVTFTFE